MALFHPQTIQLVFELLKFRSRKLNRGLDFNRFNMQSERIGVVLSRPIIIVSIQLYFQRGGGCCGQVIALYLTFEPTVIVIMDQLAGLNDKILLTEGVPKK